MPKSDIHRLSAEAEKLRPAAKRESPAVVLWAETLAKRNYILILSFSRRVWMLLAAVVVGLVAFGVTSLVLSAKQGTLGEQACRNVATLARIERDFITRQEDQSRGLLEHGVTFGIPKVLLPKLIQRSKESQAQFLAELDSLTSRNCAPNSPERRRAVLVAPPSVRGVAGVAHAPAAALGLQVPPFRATASSSPSPSRSPRASIGPILRPRTAVSAPVAPSASHASPSVPPTTIAAPAAPGVTTPRLPSVPPVEPLLTVPTIPVLPCIHSPVTAC